MGVRLSVRGRLLLRALGRTPDHRWPAHRLIAEAGVSPAPGFAVLVEELLALGLVQRHPCDDGFVRFTATPAGRRQLREGDLGG